MVKELSKIAGIRTSGAQESAVNANEVSRIARGAVIKGDISSLTDIRVDGEVDGTLFSVGRIVVGENAVLKGSVLCANVDLWGRIDGDLYVKDVLTLKSTAVVNGNIRVQKLQVEMGAQINGSCQMITDSQYDKFCSEVVQVSIPCQETKKPSRREEPVKAAPAE